MKTMRVISGEWAGKGRFPLAGLGLGLLVWVARWLPGMANVAKDEGALVIGIGLGSAVALSLAIVIGVTMLASDLEERRAGFLFSKPLGAASIWFGKLLAGMLLSVATGMAVALPSMLAHDGLRLVLGRDVAALAAGLGGLSLAALTVANALSIALRCRSAWIALEAAGLALAGYFGWNAVHRLVGGGAFGPAFFLEGAALAAVPVLYLGTGWLQVAWGRVDLRACHRLQATVSTGGFLVVAMLAQSYAGWILTTGPQGLKSAWVCELGPGGDWAVISGPARRGGLAYRPTLLWNVATGRSLNVGTDMDGAGPKGVAFSADGKRAAWWAPLGSQMERQSLWLVDLTDPALVPRETAITLRMRRMWNMVLSADGRRMAVVDRDGDGAVLRVYDLDAGQELAAVPMSNKSGFSEMAFLSPERLRVYSTTGDALAADRQARVEEFAIATRKLVQTGSFPGGAWMIREWAPASDHLLVSGGVPGTRWLALIDGRSGQELARLGTLHQMGMLAATFLADGRIAWVESTGGVATLHVADPAGGELWSLDLGLSHAYVRLRQDAGNGGLLVETHGGAKGEDLRRVVEVDLASRSLRELDFGGHNFTWARPALGGVAAKGLQARLFWNQDYSIAIRREDGSFQTLIKGSGEQPF